MQSLNEKINSVLNEAKSSLWMIYSGDSGCTYLVSASTLEEAKSLVIPVDGVEDPSGISGWLLDGIIKSAKGTSRILVDTDEIKSKGDKKY